MPSILQAPSINSINCRATAKISSIPFPGTKIGVLLTLSHPTPQDLVLGEAADGETSEEMGIRKEAGREANAGGSSGGEGRSEGRKEGRPGDNGGEKRKKQPWPGEVSGRREVEEKGGKGEGRRRGGGGGGRGGEGKGTQNLEVRRSR
ncbi:hypothetical protein AXG93_1487s1170 [Marchantia polymorpha subsp. ruderalis]|uniref:Uncharacterized protein n=1 Tax=Marchantia polymorpha subsp. ruderalis TaxID=1480154 RepID=A0A176WPL8_MARPO|nr:hypothetical protein AXG93_1487s1170 [Marchantia polymorpha subsp. ruderalis]